MSKLKGIIKAEKGFTLIEVLLVIAILAVLAGIVIVAINPSKQLANASDAARGSDVNTILNAVYQYAVDNKGQIPSTIISTPTKICNTGVSCTATTINLGVLTSAAKYLVSIPKDPTGSTTDDAGYEISKDANDRVTVSAPFTSTYAATTIKVTR